MKLWKTLCLVLSVGILAVRRSGGGGDGGNGPSNRGDDNTTRLNKRNNIQKASSYSELVTSGHDLQLKGHPKKVETPEGQRNHTQQPTDLPPNNCPQSPEEARDQLKNQVEESARATREEKPFVLTKNERGPVTGGVIDRTSGESRVYVNQDTPPPDMHPKVKERYDQMMQDTNGQGYAPDQKSRPGSHAEVWAYSDLLNQRGADSDPNANDFLVYNVWNDGSKRDTFARCCANCSYLLDGVIDADKE